MPNQSPTHTEQESTSKHADVRYRWRLLDAGPLMLDGGSMFGVVPRVVWTKTRPPNEANQIALRHNLLLLETIGNDPLLGRPRRVLIEAGSGDKLTAKMKFIFGLGPQTAESAVIDAGLKPDQIDDAVVTHLHFDHAGGLTRLARPGETNAWTGDDRGGGGGTIGVVPTFPNARIHTQTREWADATANSAVMTKTYYLDHLLPLQDQLALADSPAPFASLVNTGQTPARDALPDEPVTLRWTQIRPGIRVFRVPGHTWGQQAVHFTASDGREVVFVPDVLPTVHHSGAAYSLAYDVEPYTSMLSKRWLLTEAAQRSWLLVLDHEPDTPVVTAHEDGHGWFVLRPDPDANRTG